MLSDADYAELSGSGCRVFHWRRAPDEMCRAHPGQLANRESKLPSMWPRRCHSPLQLGAIAVGGVVLLLLTLVAVVLLPKSFAWIHPLSMGWGARWLQWLGGLTLLLPGLVLEVRAISVLNQGVRLERWRDEEVNALRVLVEKPVWNALVWSLTVLLALLVLLLPRHSSFSSAWCFIWMPLNLLSALRNALRKPASTVPSIVDWPPRQPLHSERWGQRV